MASLTSLPAELLTDIVKLLLPQNDRTPVIGINASWTDPNVFVSSLWSAASKPQANSSSIGGESLISVYSPLVSLRSTSSLFNTLCIPFLYQDINILESRSWSRDMLELIIIPYSQHIKTVRISLDVVSDEEAADVLNNTRNITSLLLYRAYLDNSRVELTYDRSRLVGDWMKNTREAIVTLLEEGSLEALGLYSRRLMLFLPRIRGIINEDDAPALLLRTISANLGANSSLKKLDLCLGGLHPGAYEVVRNELTSLESLTFHYMFRQDALNDPWVHDGRKNRSQYSNLTSLQFRRCQKVSAPHIPFLVRHFVSLKHLLVSICGQSTDVKAPSPPPRGWFEAEDALWKVRQPLEVFQLDHTSHWELGCLGEIPVSTFIVSNFPPDDLANVFKDDENYYPELKVIRIPSAFSDGTQSFSGYNLPFLEDFCRQRGVEVRMDAPSIQ